MRLTPTAGAAENIALLREPDSGRRHRLRQGGAEPSVAHRRRRRRNDGLVSLGSLFYEPVWLFYRGDSAERLLQGARS